MREKLETIVGVVLALPFTTLIVVGLWYIALTQDYDEER